MKRFVPAVFALLLPVLAPADWVVENEIDNAQTKINATIKSKGDKFRVDVANGPRGAMSTILDTSTGQIILLRHRDKEARKTTNIALRQRIETLKKKGAPEGATPPKATGEKEKIGDWDCEIYTWENEKTSAKLWVATNIPKAAEIKAMLDKLDSGGLGEVGARPDVSALAGVVVKSESTSPRGKSTTTYASIKEQSVDAAEFTIPKDYELKQPPTNLRGVPPSRSGIPEK